MSSSQRSQLQRTYTHAMAWIFSLVFVFLSWRRGECADITSSVKNHIDVWIQFKRNTVQKLLQLQAVPVWLQKVPVPAYPHRIPWSHVCTLYFNLKAHLLPVLLEHGNNIYSRWSTRRAAVETTTTYFDETHVCQRPHQKCEFRLCRP